MLNPRQSIIKGKAIFGGRVPLEQIQWIILIDVLYVVTTKQR